MDNQMIPKWIILPLGVVLLILLGVMTIARIYDFNQTVKDKTPKHTISVSAEGKVPGTPDLATVNLGVLSQGATALAVQDINTQKVNKIIDFVKSQGISKEDIATSQFNVYPQQDYQSGKSNIIGYQVNQTITIKVRGVDQSTEKLGKIISGVTEQGANQINGVTMSFDDPDSLRGKARELAISKAKQKAAELAKAAGITLGRVVSVSESGGGGYPVPYYAADSMMRSTSPAMEKTTIPDIEPGSQDITATMTLEFEIK